MRTSASRRAARLLILSVALCFVLLYICPALLCARGHDCSGTDCPLCGLVSLLTRGAAVCSAVLALGVTNALCCACPSDIPAAGVRHDTPVSLRTKLLN